jgi:2-succinyl-5-enolpyruvyl-6-hydroxy-3-cyclohexene-1-carboxylate synthase
MVTMSVELAVAAHGQVLDASVGAFVDELSLAGIGHVCICPGSRSTPLAIKFAQHTGVKVWMHLDERSAAFFGLGLAIATRAPVALLATSGTAAANFLPAVVEAALARVPLVVLTADRPHELREVGAPQTIDQLRLYGQHAKWFFDLPEPEADLAHLRLVRTIAARAVGTAMAEPAGPVHLNWPFREPLVPLPADGDHVSADGVARRPGPRVTVVTGRLAPSVELVGELADSCRSTDRGLIVCGPQDDPALPGAVSALAASTGYPLLADALSDARTGPHDRSGMIVSYDAFLREPSLVAGLAPELILRFGAVPTSKPLTQALERWTTARQVVVDPGGWREPTARATDLLHVDPTLLVRALTTRLERARTRNSDWQARWRQLDALARATIEASFEQQTELSEGRIFIELQQLLPSGSTIFAGNSMPVRDLDTFLGSSATPVRCLANRGANGIDGVVSTALGVSAMVTGPVVLVIGDVSMYHDLNGLLSARQHHLDLLVILVNNDGGGIFSFLSQAESASVGEHFEALFGTPHGLDFRPFVDGYGGQFSRVGDWPGFREHVSRWLEGPRGLRVIEVPSDRSRNVEQHRALWRAVSHAANEWS